MSADGYRDIGTGTEDWGQKPSKGDRITYRGVDAGTAVRVDGNLCWTLYDAHPHEALPFIWHFKDGLNELHDWPGKVSA